MIYIKASAKVVTLYEAGNLLSKAIEHPALYYSGKLMLATAIPGAIVIGVGSINNFAETIEILANNDQNAKDKVIKNLEATSIKLVNEVIINHLNITDYRYNPLKHIDLLAPAIYAATLAAGKIGLENNAVSEISGTASKILA